MRSFLRHLLPQAFRFLNDRVLDRAEFFLLREWIMLTGAIFIVALQRVADTIPDGIIRRHLRQLFQLIHDFIDLILERLFEITILLFAADHAQFRCKFQQLLLDRCGRIRDRFHAVNQIVHDCPRRFGHILVSCIFPDIEIFQFRLKDAVGHRRSQFHNSIPLQNSLLIRPEHHVNVWMCVCVVVSCVPVQCRCRDMERFCKLVLLADEQLAPCGSVVVSQAFRVLAMQRVYDRPNVSVVRGQVVHRRSQIRIFLPTEQTVCAMLFRTGARCNIAQIAVFGLKILHM